MLLIWKICVSNILWEKRNGFNKPLCIFLWRELWKRCDQLCIGMHYSNYETRLTTAAFPFEVWESKLHIFYNPPLFQLYSQCFIFKGNCNPGLLLTSWLCSFTIKSGDGVPVIFMISLSWSRSNSEIWLRKVCVTDFWYSIVSFLFSLQVQWDQHEETVKTGKWGISLNFAVKWRIQVVTLKHRLHIKDGKGYTLG